jgi:hypothetical protein
MPKRETRNATRGGLPNFDFRISIFGLGLLALLLLPTSAKAQTYTAIAGTIVDPNGLPYAGALVTFSLTPHSGQATITPCKVSPCPVAIPGTAQADATGTFTVTLLANGSILPAGTQWVLGVTEPGVPLPWGTGPQQFTYTFTASGASQNLSAAMSALAPALTMQGYQPPPGPYPGPVFNILLYGGKGDLRTCTVTTNSTVTITGAGANPCSFTAADVGKIAWVMNPSTNATICASQTQANSITGQGGTTATLLHACTASLAATAVAYIGTDNYTPLQKMATAIIAANGGVGYAPSGNFLVAGPASGNVLAFNVTSAVTGTVSLKGNGEFDTVFYPAPWIRTSESFAGELFNFDNQSAAVIQDLGINGYGFGKSNDQGLGLIGAQNGQVDRIAIENYNWADSNCYYDDPSVALGIPAWFNYSICDSIQYPSIGWTNANIAIPSISAFDLVADVISGPLDMNVAQPATVNILHGVYLANAAGLSDVGLIGLAPISLTNLATLNVTNVQVCSNGQSGYLFYNASAFITMHLSGVSVDSAACPAAGTNVTDVGVEASGARVSVQTSELNANGTGSNFNLAAGAQAFDLGGPNTVSGGAGILTGAGALFGSASITGTAQTAANITPSTGWGTAGTAGAGVSAVSGDSHAEYFTVTAAGTPTANPTIAIVLPTPFWQAPHCTASQIGGTGIFSDVTQSTLPTSTGLTLTWQGTPTAAQTYLFSVSCQ